MLFSSSCTSCLILFLAFSAHLSISGFDFLTNQYVYFRYSEDAGLPYVPEQTFKQLSSIKAGHTPHNETQESVQSSTAQTLAILSFLSLGFSFFAALFVGHLSDRYNRRFAIALVLLGQGLSNIVTAFVVLLHLPVLVLIIASLARGIVGGGLIALIAQLCVYFADMTRIPTNALSLTKGGDHTVQDKQSHLEGRRLLLLGACDASLFSASAVGYGLMGSLIQRCGFTVSVVGLLGVYCIPVFLLWFLPREQHNPLTSVDAVVFDSSVQTVHGPNGSSLMQPVVQTVPSGLTGVLAVLKSHQPTTTLVLITLFLYFTVVLSENQYTFLYLMAEPFDWTPEQVGFYSGFSNLVLGIASLVLTLFIVRLLRSNPDSDNVNSNSRAQSLSGSTVALLDTNEPSDFSINVSTVAAGSSLPRDLSDRLVLRLRRLMLIYISCGLFMVVLNKLLMGFAFLLHSPWCHVTVFIALFASFARAGISPTLKSFLSSVHSHGSQGRLFSLIGAAEYCGMLVGIPGLSGLYGTTVSIYPGVVYFFSAGLIFIAVILIIWLIYLSTRESSSIGQLETDEHQT